MQIFIQNQSQRQENCQHVCRLFSSGGKILGGHHAKVLKRKLKVVIRVVREVIRSCRDWSKHVLSVRGLSLPGTCIITEH